MNLIFLVVSTVGVTAVIFVLHFIIYIIRKWLEARRLKHVGIEATARILKVQVINESGRYLPFVRLKLEINADEQNSFISEADSFFSIPELPELIAGNSIRIRYNPSDVSQVQIRKDAPSFEKRIERSWQPLADTNILALSR